jgi:hypothetical protein
MAGAENELQGVPQDAAEIRKPIRGFLNTLAPTRRHTETSGTVPTVDPGEEV